MNLKATRWLLILFSITTLVSLHACKDEDDDRNHVWVVDQDGIARSLLGDWQIISNTHPNSVDTPGIIWMIPDPEFVVDFLDQGVYTDEDGIAWTNVWLRFSDGNQAYYLERLNSNSSPEELHVVVKTDENGNYQDDYPEWPYTPPDSDYIILNKL